MRIIMIGCVNLRIYVVWVCVRMYIRVMAMCNPLRHIIHAHKYTYIHVHKYTYIHVDIHMYNTQDFLKVDH